jgi:hypothetical protein
MPVIGEVTTRGTGPAISEKVAGALTPLALALAVRLPTDVAVALTEALPLLSVKATPPLVKLSPAPLNVTVTPDTGFELASFTCTTSALVKLVFELVPCPEPDTTLTVAG